jgi:hypothetical protein
LKESGEPPKTRRMSESGHEACHAAAMRSDSVGGRWERMAVSRWFMGEVRLWVGGEAEVLVPVGEVVLGEEGWGDAGIFEADDEEFAAPWDEEGFTCGEAGALVCDLGACDGDEGAEESFGGAVEGRGHERRGRGRWSDACWGREGLLGSAAGDFLDIAP